MRKCLLAFLIVLWAAPAWAAITCSTSNFTTNLYAADETPDLALTVPAETNRAVVLGIHDRSESASIDSVSDSGGGTWTLGAGPTSHSGTTIRAWTYYRTGGSTGAITVTVDFSGAVNSALAAGTCYSDTASLDFVSSAAVMETSSGTAHTSNTRTFTTTGIILGFFATNVNTSVSAVGTNQTNLTNTTARGHIVSRAESSGTQGLDITTGGATFSLGSALLFQEAATGGGGCPGMLLRGVCE